jgi:hypothetical protein
MTRPSRVDVDHAAAMIDELRLLIRQIPDALPRDQGHGGDITGGSGDVHSSGLNDDVLMTWIDLRTAIPQWRAWAQRAAGEPVHGDGDLDRDLVTTARCMRRLASTNAPDLAERLADEVFRWRRKARLAIGLTRHDRDLEMRCPLHSETGPALRLRGDEGVLRRVGAGSADPITWLRGDVIFCPDCGAQWDRALWPLLGRLLDAKSHQEAG